MAFTDTLKEKAGPLPVWAWGAILGLVVVAGMWWYSSRGTTTASAAGTTEAYPELGEGSMTSAGGAADVGSSTDTSSSLPDFASNLAWQTYVMARMTAQGYSPLEVQAALEAYLNGDTLSKTQAEIVNYAVAKYGSPPNGTLGVSTIVADAAKNVAAGAATVVSGSPTYVTGSGPTGSVSSDLVSSSQATALGATNNAAKVDGFTVRTGANGNVTSSANGVEVVIPGSQSVETLLRDMKNAVTPSTAAAYKQALANRGVFV